MLLKICSAVKDKLFVVYILIIINKIKYLSSNIYNN
jgi:hypothetical protein